MAYLTVLLSVFIGFIPHEVFLINYFITYGIVNGVALPVFLILFTATNFIIIPTTYAIYNFLHLRFLKKYMKSGRFGKMTEKLRQYAYHYGGVIGLILLGFLGNSWLASLLAAFLKFKMRDALIWLTFGSLMFFLILYLNITGLLNVIPKFSGSISVVILMVFIISIIIRLIIRKVIEKLM